MFRKLTVTFITLLLVLGTGAADALQVKSARDSQTLLFRISAKEYSRIFVSDDRIVSVKGKNTAFESRQFGGHEDDGAIFVRPVDGRPFSLFIATESGRHFTLMLVASDIPAENIRIIPVSAVAKKARHWETSAPYTQTLIDLMRAMRNNTHPEGYAVINMGKIKKTKSHALPSALSLQLRTIFRGGYLQGEIWELCNSSGHPVSVHPQNFKNGFARVMAVSLASENIPAYGNTVLYRIVSHE